MASLYDVAREAGVSKTLVSRVLNAQKGVSDVSKERILNAIKKLNYKPNALARQLVLQRTQTIGVVLDTLCEPYFFALIQGIEKEIATSDYDVIFCSGVNQMEQKSRYINFFSQGRADGVIIYGSKLNDCELIEKLSRTNLPFVVVENLIENLNVNYILVDNAYGSNLAVEHLLDCNCKSICHVKGDTSVKVAVDRCNGYIDSMLRHNIPASEHLILDGGFTFDSGYHAIAQFLDTHSRDDIPDAFYFGADAAAFGGLIAFEDFGIRVPEDVMVVGFDDDKPLNFDRMHKKLTTLHQPLFEMGSAAVSLLLQEINEESAEKQKIVYYPELIIRETTIKK